MLVLSRRTHEKILIPSIKTAIEVVSIKPGAVRLGIEAPPDVTVLREEVFDRAAEWGPPDAAPTKPAEESRERQIRQVLRNRLTIACKGVEQIRRAVEAGDLHQAGAVLDRLEEDLRLLQRRVEEPAAPPPPAGRPRQVRRALLVEDDRDQRELLATLLRLSGVEVDTAGDGLDALHYLRSHRRPDVVLLDMGLPRCDGAATVRSIRRDPELADLTIYAVTGRAPDEFPFDRGTRGIDRWFRKPLDSEALVRDLTQGLQTANQ